MKHSLVTLARTVDWGFLEQALAVTRELGDRQQEADLLWQLGIQHAELGQRDAAVACLQAAVNLLRQLGKQAVHGVRGQGSGIRDQDLRTDP